MNSGAAWPSWIAIATSWILIFLLLPTATNTIIFGSFIEGDIIETITIDEVYGKRENNFQRTVGNLETAVVQGGELSSIRSRLE
jgi:hypothetical protein